MKTPAYYAEQLVKQLNPKDYLEEIDLDLTIEGNDATTKIAFFNSIKTELRRQRLFETKENGSLMSLIDFFALRLAARGKK